MTGWAATNTLRDVVALAYRRAAASPDACREADAALALVETALDAHDRLVAAANARAEFSWDEMDSDNPEWVKVRDEFIDATDASAAALRAVREGAA